MKHLKRDWPIYLCILIGAFIARAAHAGTASLTWSAPTTNADGTPLTDLKSYKVYGALQGQTKTLLATVLAPTVTYTHNGPTEGQTWCYTVSAVDAVGNESVMSNESCKTVPNVPPSPPVLQTVTVTAMATETPVFTVTNGGRGVMAGLMPPGKACSGPVLFVYRGSSFYKVNATDVHRWGTPLTANFAAPCKAS